MSKTWKIVLICVAVVVLLAILGKISADDRKIPRVTTARVAVEDMVSKVTANGKVQAEKKVDMSALVMGQIVNLAVRNGDPVRKGDFLLQIDRNQAAAGEAGSAAALQASVAARDSAKATLEQARRGWDRRQEKHSAGGSSGSRFPESKNGPRDRGSRFRGGRSAHRPEPGELERLARHAFQDDSPRSNQRYRDRLAGQRGRSHGHRNHEQPGNTAVDDFRHVERRGCPDGGRNGRSQRQGRAERSGRDRGLSRTLV